ncbi:pimeloyl-ACP methyl ester carboxylesterase [Paraburkholderia terricola]|uniref:alpha/beta fold hydrolase n=1 Tax=Paraburkholderia terricola TaxID=169427 RepID=UPI00285F4B5F|nr:alpha/beta fold hydrolase [Paraburkholderia terricola]MDR6449614.1 pimeloyl-ACP methyl ester carboxylesterase [Paraburkholderia terricola]
MSRRKLVAVGDTRAWVWDDGEPRTPLVLCHGFTTTSEFWREQVEVFQEDYLVVAINLPGHGIAPAPVGRPYTMDAFVDDLYNVFTALRLRDAVLVGLSMGGTVSQRFALKHCDLLEKLVLVGATSHGLGADVDASNVLDAISLHGVQKASQDVIDRSFAGAASPALVEFARKEVLQTPEHVARTAIVSLNTADTRESLAHIGVPTLIVCGEEDVITPPSESQALADGIPDASLLLMPGAGHFPMLEKPAEFNAALRTFLDPRA